MSRLCTALGVGLVLVALAACSRDEPRLLNLRSSADGPDEFSVLPTRPLEMPDNLTELPTPTPGAANRADPDPEADLAAALGGNINRAPSGGQGLISHASRFGVTQGIRQTLAAEDLEFRRRHDARLLERTMAVNVYHRAYSTMMLDRYAELARLRRAGIRTPAAPPQDIGNIE